MAHVTKLNVIALIAILLIPTLVSADESQQRDPNTTLLISFVPGCIIHGSGHYYLGDWKMGTGLLVLEAVGIGLTVSAISGHAINPTKEAEEKIEPWVWAGQALFWGTWLYDIVAPQIKLRKNNQSSLSFLPRPGGAQVKFVYRF